MHRTIGVLLIAVALTGCALDFPQATQPPLASEAVGGLHVAWVETGDLWTATLGQTAPRVLASGGVVRPYLSPDGAHAAFTRGADGRPQALWVADLAGQRAVEWVPAARIDPSGSGMMVLYETIWLDGQALVFSTARVTATGLSPQHDLWRADLNARTVSLLLEAGEGGSIHLSPDGARLALVYPGAYGVRDGRIRVVDLLAQQRDDLFSFTGVSSGANFPFYAPVFWTPDSQAVHVAIPDKDLIYQDDGRSPVQLWRLSLDGNRDVLGTVPASFFGLPRWSADGSRLLYLRRMDSASGNQFELILAAPNGDNPARYDTGLIGSLGLADWLPGAAVFAYVQGTPGQYWYGRPGAARQALPGPMFAPRFVSAEQVVYASAPAGDFELLALRLGDSQAQRIAPVTNPVPVFDVILN